MSSVTAGPLKYGQSASFTVDGVLLDDTLVVSTPVCANVQRSTVAPGCQHTHTVVLHLPVDRCWRKHTNDQPSDPGVLGSVPFEVPLPQVTLTVSNGRAVSGDLLLTLDPTKVKITVDNFLQYVNDGFYSGTIFHRVVVGFVAQGGGYLTSNGGAPQAKATRAPIALEVGKGLSNVMFSVAMARTTAPQFGDVAIFRESVDNSASLDPGPATAGYAVFGTLTAGREVLTSIVAAPCAAVSGLSECAPNPDIVITAAPTKSR